MCSFLWQTASQSKALYEATFLHGFTPLLREKSLDYLGSQLNSVVDAECDLPTDLTQLEGWMRNGHDAVIAHYDNYLARRKIGGHREYFRKPVPRAELLAVRCTNKAG